MIVGIQSGGIGKVDLGQTGGTADKAKSKDKASGTFADLMNLASVNTNVQTASPANQKNDVDAVKQADTTAPDKKKQTDLYKYEKTDAKADTTRAGAKKTESDDATQTAENEDWKAELLSDKMKKLLKVDEETLQNLLQTAGLTMQDLLDPAVMKDFILQINDATSVDLLLDESLNDLMQQAMQLLDEVSAVSEEMVLPADTADAEVLPEKIIPEQMEQQTTSADVDETQSQPVKSETVSRTVPEDNRGQNDEKNADVLKTDAEIPVTVVTEETGNSDASSDLMKQNAEGVISNLNQAMAQISGEEIAAAPFDTAVSQADIVRQVVDEIKLHLSKDVTSMTLQLNPEQLGRIQIHVSTKNGVMQAQIIAESEAAKTAVESGLAALKEAFENQDLKVDAIEVMVGTPDYFAEQSGMESQADAQQEKMGNPSHPVNLNGHSDDDINEDASLETEMMKAQGNQVNYMA